MSQYFPKPYELFGREINVKKLKINCIKKIYLL